MTEKDLLVLIAQAKKSLRENPDPPGYKSYTSITIDLARILLAVNKKSPTAISNHIINSME